MTYGAPLELCVSRERKWRPQSWSRRKRSKPILAILDQHLNRGNNTVAEDRPRAGFEIRPFDGLAGLSVLWHDIGKNRISLAKLDGLPGLEPGLEPSRVAQLTKVDAWIDTRHRSNVTQNVARCQSARTDPGQSHELPSWFKTGEMTVDFIAFFWLQDVS